MLKLKELRKEKGVTQATVAKYLGVSPQAYGFYETGKRNPDIDMLLALSQYFDVSVDYLVGKTDDKKRTSWDNEYHSSILASIDMDFEKYLELINKLFPQNNFTVVLWGMYNTLEKYQKETILNILYSFMRNEKESVFCKLHIGEIISETERLAKIDMLKDTALHNKVIADSEKFFAEAGIYKY